MLFKHHELIKELKEQGQKARAGPREQKLDDLMEKNIEGKISDDELDREMGAVYREARERAG